MTASDPWLRHFRRCPDATAHMICLPHAGGSASAFRRWPDFLPDDVDLLAVQYPGREDRYGEAFATGIQSVADDIAMAVLRLVDRPIFLFGHSMGASIAYEVALRLERCGVVPVRVFVSAHPPPHRQRNGDLHRQDDDALVADARRLAGNVPTLLDDPEVRALFLPILRADYRMIETYRSHNPVPLATAIDLLLPIDDGKVTRDEGRAWQDISRCPLTVHEVTGGHFYLQQQPHRLLARLLPRLRLR